MNKQQQELYDKLLKKVNEYCLGAAAEDVIEAIDNLVDEYEYPVDRSNTTKDVFKALQVIYNSQDIMGGHDDFWEAYRIVETALRDAKKYKKALKIIKEKKVDIECEITKTTDYTDYLAEWRDYLEEDALLTQEEYELLKEVCKR